MRPLIAIAIAIVITIHDAQAQAINPEFVYLRDYLFEKTYATRHVDDADDKGAIRLVTYIWRPVKGDRHEVVLFSHGSTAGLTRSPQEPAAGDLPPGPLVRYFISRGYTIVAPMRRGRSESTGNYVEECSFYAGKCSAEQQLALTDRGLRSALADVNAVIDQVILGKLVPRDAKILLAGHSRGGFLALLLAAERPSAVKGVVNFAGGWHGANDRLTQTQWQERIDTQAVRLTRAAKRTRTPTLWIYAARDPFYNDAAPRAILKAWQDAGGRAEFVWIAEHSLPNPHGALSSPQLWQKQMDAYLNTLESAK